MCVGVVQGKGNLWGADGAMEVPIVGVGETKAVSEGGGELNWSKVFRGRCELAGSEPSYGVVQLARCERRQ